MTHDLHSHNHHHHARQTLNYSRSFALGVILNVSFVAIEAGDGLWTDSLALIADAGLHCLHAGASLKPAPTLLCGLGIYISQTGGFQTRPYASWV